ncbi:MAG TPA: hypothetical protein VI316_04440 [Candidatus Dormibacteraeota bacterium]
MPTEPGDAVMLPPVRLPRQVGTLRSALWTHRWLWPGVLIFAVARTPAWLEPHWYTDEAGYATTAKMLTRGATLYSDIWTNKPPLHLWTLALPVWLAGGSEAALHAVTFLTGLLALAAVAYAAHATLTAGRAAFAVAVAAVLLGTPILDGELALPESLLIAPTAWAGAVIITRLHRGTRGSGRELWPLGAGALTACALAVQQTAVADAAAFGLILLVAPTATRKQLGVYAATVVGCTACWLLAAAAWAGPGTVAFALAGFYVAYSQAVLPGSASGLLQHAVFLLSSVLLLIAAAVLLRHSRPSSWAYAVWAGATLLVAAAAQQPYAHFLLPAAVPASLALAALPVPGLQWRRGRQVAGAWFCAAGLLVTCLLARTAGLDWMPVLASQGQNSYRTLADYYGGPLQVVTGQESLATWQATFDDRVPADEDTAAWIRTHGLSGRTAVVWSSDAWPYLEADLPLLLRTAPIYNDEVLLGSGGPLAAAVAALAPDLVIASDDAVQTWPEITALLDNDYHQAVRFGPDAVWLRDGLSGA